MGNLGVFVESWDIAARFNEGIVINQPGENNSTSTKTTIFKFTKDFPSGSSFSNEPPIGGGHSKVGEDADLGLSSNEFISFERIQVYLGGTNLIKNDYLTWVDQGTFILNLPVSNGDWIKILS